MESNREKMQRTDTKNVAKKNGYNKKYFAFWVLQYTFADCNLPSK